MRGRNDMSTRPKAGNIKLKRAYEPAARDDGMRVLVDRLWPRGVSQADAALDHWMKELAPTTALRKWFGHDAARWEEFRRRYADEVRQHPEQFVQLRGWAREGSVTLIYAARDEARNEAVVLRALILGRPTMPRSSAARNG